MRQAGMFEMDNRMGKIDRNGDPLAKLNEVVDWEMFRTTPLRASPPCP